MHTGGIVCENSAPPSGYGEWRRAHTLRRRTALVNQWRSWYSVVSPSNAQKVLVHLYRRIVAAARFPSAVLCAESGRREWDQCGDQAVSRTRLRNGAIRRDPSRCCSTDWAVDAGGSWLPAHLTTAETALLSSRTSPEIRSESTPHPTGNVIAFPLTRSLEIVTATSEQRTNSGRKYIPIIIQPSADFHRMTSFWTFVGVAASVATALPWDGASPTDPVVAVGSLGWTPIPTQPPRSPYGGETVPAPGKHIFARAFTDQLCGYVNGNSGEFEYRRALAVCADGGGSAVWAWSCIYSLATCTSSSGWLGCCYPEPTGTCSIVTTCIVSLSMRSGDSSRCRLTDGGSRAQLSNRNVASRV